MKHSHKKTKGSFTIQREGENLTLLHTKKERNQLTKNMFTYSINIQ